MTKKDQHFETAERLYVNEHKTIESIAEILPVCERTLRYWKDEGMWDRKRCSYIETRKSFKEELVDVSRILLKEIREDVDKEGKVSEKKDLSLKRLVSMIKEIAEFEANEKTESNETKTTVDDIVLTVRRELGLEPDA